MSVDQVHSARSDEPFTAHVDETSEGEWATLLDQFADANLYQTWAYGATSWGEEQLSHLVLKQAGRPVGLAQLRLVCVPVLGAGVAYLRYGPVCVRHGSSWDSTIYRATTEALIHEYAHRRRLLLRVVPHTFEQDAMGPETATLWSQLKLLRDSAVSPYRTIRIDLSGTMEELRKQLDQKWRNQLNRAERNDLTVLEGSGDDLYQQFLELYREMMARKQFDTSVDVDVFRSIQQRLPESQKMLILISLHNGRPMTALIGSTVGETGIYLLGATSTEGMKTKGSYLLQWHMMQRLKERGCRWYDLGGINPENNPGVYHFKKGMGGADVTQLGRCSISGGLISTLTVSGGERLTAAVARLKKKPQGDRPATTSPSPAINTATH